MSEQLLDVVEVSISSGKVVAFMAEQKDERNADAVIKMAVMRRGVDKSFYADVPSGRYKVGDVYEGLR